MARNFVRASSQVLTFAGNLGLSAPPITLSCWFKSSNLTDNQTLISIINSSGLSHFQLMLFGAQAGDPILARAASETAGSGGITTTGYSAGVWHHACGVFVSSSERHAYIDGSSKGSDTASRLPTSLNQSNIGALIHGAGNYCDAVIAEVAIFGRALNDAEVALLARGMSPFVVSPGNLVAYTPLWGDDPEISPVGGFNWTLTNGPTYADHPPISYYAPPITNTLSAPEVRVTQTGAHVEMESDDGQLLVTQMGVHIEFGAAELRVSQLGVHIEIEEEPPLPTYQVRRTGGRAVHMRLPEEVTGYALDPSHSWWSVVVPEETENWIENPSFENGTTGFIPSLWASNARVTGDAIGATRGAYSWRLTNTASVEATLSYTVPNVPPGAWTWSLDVYVPRTDVTLILRTFESSTARNTTFTFNRTGWQRIEVTRVSLASSNWSLILISPDTNTVSVPFRTDGWQFENKRYSTSYADGDMSGWYDTQVNQSYFWLGIPHDSKSVRRARTGTGGKIVYFSDLVNGIDFKTTAIVGAGMGPVEMDTVRVGYEREVHRGVRFMPRDFTITGKIIACSYDELYQARNALINILRPRTLTREPLILRYQVTDDVGREASLPLEIICAYSDGLRGNITNFYQENIGLQFHASTPFWMEEFESAADLGTTPYESLVSNRIVYRDADGVYQNLGTGVTNENIVTLKFDADGVPMAGGVFTQIGGDLVDYLAAWDGTNWVELGDGPPNNFVRVIDVIPETNTIIIGGAFTIAGGAVVLRIAYLNGVFWDSLTTVESGFSSGEVLDLTYDRYSGNIFAVGASNNGTNFTYYAAIGDNAWTPLPNGGLDSLQTVLSTHDGYVWFGGSFQETVDTNIQLARVARYNIEDDAWEVLGSGFNGTVRKLIQGRDGSVYAFGGFNRDGNDNYDLRGAARWNGTTWEEVVITRSTLATPDAVAVHPDGTFWYGNSSFRFPSAAYGLSYMLGWANGVEYPPLFQAPADATGISTLTFAPDGSMLAAVRLSSASPTLAPKQISVDLESSADSLPVFVLRNGQRVRFIENLDAAVGLYFRDDFVLQNSERLFINLAGSRPRFYSDVRFNLTRHIYTGASNLGSFTLRPGTNRIMIFCTDADATVRNSLVWRNRFLSSDSVSAL